MNVEDKLKVAVIAAVQAYIDNEQDKQAVHAGQVLNAWKMGARRELMNRRKLANRGNPARVSLRRYSFL
jgi:hypothetical protein